MPGSIETEIYVKAFENAFKLIEIELISLNI